MGPLMSFFQSISRLPLPIALALSVVVLCGWIPDFLACDYSSFATAFPLFLTFALTLLNAYILFRLLLNTGVVRFRDFLPVFLFLLTTTAFPIIHCWWQLQVAILFTTILVQVIHRAYREEETAHDCFLATSFALIAALFLPEAVCMIPLIWLAYVLLRSMNLRTALGSIIAIALFAIYAAIAVLFFDVPLPAMEQVFGGLSTAVHAMSFAQIVLLAIFLAFHLAFLITIAVRIDRDSIAQQSLLLLLFLFFLPAAAATLFFRQRDSLARGVVFCLYTAFLLTTYALHWLLP